MKRDRYRGLEWGAKLLAPLLVLAIFSIASSTVHAAAPDLRSKEVAQLGDSIAVIDQAADRNQCTGDERTLLYAVRLAENGPPGMEFGVLNPRAAHTNLDTQAGWCAASIMHAHQRWLDAGRPGDFVEYLGRRYSPPDANPTWLTNVTYWYKTFGGEPFS